MANPLPSVVCPKCHLSQTFRGQKSCIHNGCQWSNFDIAVQLNRRPCQGDPDPLRRAWEKAKKR